MQEINPARRRKIRELKRGENPNEFESITNYQQSLTLLDLASNDYLSLSRHPSVINAAQEIIHSDGVGSGASRLISGTRPIHSLLENSLAEWLGQESVLLFPSGFQANLAATVALADRNTIVIADKLIHYSLLIGVKASGAQLKRFSHNNLEELSKVLKLCREKRPSQRVLVITESLFSMEGTSPIIKEVAALCSEAGAQLLIDEAHAIGIMGIEGRGLCYGLTMGITMITGTFGKAFGSGGAFIASTREMREKLIQCSGAFKYTTSLAPPLAAASLAALKLIQHNPNWGKDLQKNSMCWRDALSQKGWTKPPGNGPILSLIIGEDQAALNLQTQIEKAGMLCMAIRPPTVPENTARLRIVLRRNLPFEALGRFLDALNSQ